MTVRHFVPELWAARMVQPFEKALVFGQPSVVNREYEGLIANMGDTVRINTIGDPTISTYTTNTDMSAPEALSDAQTTLTITQSPSFHFQVDDVDARQANVSFMSDAMRRAAYKLADTADQFIATTMGSACGTELFAATSPSGNLGTEGALYDHIVNVQVALDELNAPNIDRFLILPPYCVGVLRKDSNIVASGAEAADMRQINGMVTRIAGINILQSNNVPTTTAGTEFHCIAGWGGATTFASQLSKIEAYRPELRFADAIKGLQLYGAKVVQPDGLVGLWLTRI